MEVNQYGDTLLPAFAKEDIVEGRMVKLTTHAADYDFGSKLDLPGARLPDTASEAALCRYVIAFAEDNRSLPIYQDTPHYDWALRQGWDQTANSPFSVDVVYLTHPNNMECRTIPSGNAVKLFGEGIYTVLSGCYKHSAQLEVPGCQLTVANTAVDGATDAGKLKYLDNTTGIVAETYFYDSTTGDLTFKVLH